MFHYSILTVLTLRCKQTKLPPVSNAHCSCYNYEYLLFFARAVIGSLKIATCRCNTKYIKVFWLAVFSSPPPLPVTLAGYINPYSFVCAKIVMALLHSSVSLWMVRWAWSLWKFYNNEQEQEKWALLTGGNFVGLHLRVKTVRIEQWNKSLTNHK